MDIKTEQACLEATLDVLRVKAKVVEAAVAEYASQGDLRDIESLPQPSSHQKVSEYVSQIGRAHV